MFLGARFPASPTSRVKADETRVWLKENGVTTEKHSQVHVKKMSDVK